jgi:uncharacterized protein YceK
MKYAMMLMVLAAAGCGDVPRLTVPEEAAADRAAHDAYLAEKYDAEYLADCAYYGLEEC